MFVNLYSFNKNNGGFFQFIYQAIINLMLMLLINCARSVNKSQSRVRGSLHRIGAAATNSQSIDYRLTLKRQLAN